MKNRILVAAACLLALSTVASAKVDQEKILPDFTLVAPNGAETGSAALQSPGQWALLFVVPGSGPSDNMVQKLGEQWTPERAAKTVFIVSGTPEAAKAYLAGKGGEALAADARWFADPQGAAWQALKFQGKFALIGMAGSRIDWRMDGVIADPAVVWPTLAKWVGNPEP